MLNEDDLRYPIGRFQYSSETSWEELKKAIKDIAVFPSWLSETAANINNDELNSTYRDGSWNVRQIIHHIADSHTNAYIRFKLALTEDRPIIKPYKENLWSELHDAKHLEIQPSLYIIEGIHDRWVSIMENLEPDDFKREYFHPELYRLISLSECAMLYSWHGRHHLRHIQMAVEVNV